MIDFNEQSNYEYDEYPSFNNSFMKNNEGYFSEEKGTSFATTNQFNYENNEPYLNETSNPFYILYNESEYNENDIDNSFLNKKTKRDEDIKYENKIFNKNECNNIFIIENKLGVKKELNNNKNKQLKNEEKKKNKLNNLGRKKQDSGEIGQHNKNCKDNIMNKIKTNFFNDYIRDIIKKNSLKKDIDLKKLRTKEFIADLTKQTNERLFNMKIKDILCEQPISTKYSTFDTFENKLIIEKIYKENKEINVIKILELTFEELFIIYRRTLKDPDDIEKLEEIKAKIEGLDLLEENNWCGDIGYLIEKLKKNHDEEYNLSFYSYNMSYIRT